MQKLGNKEVHQTARASNRSKKGKTNSHGATNQMTQAKAIKADGIQQGNRIIKKISTQRT